MVWDFPSSSLRVKATVPIPSASIVPTIPLIPTLEIGLGLFLNSFSAEHIWCVAQLSTPNVVASDSRKKVDCAAVSSLELVNETTFVGMLCVVKHMG